MRKGLFLGEVQYTKDIGGIGNHRVEWCKCLNCGKLKWKRITLNGLTTRSPYCRPCGVHLAKIKKSIAVLNKDDIIRKYTVDDLSAADIANQYNITITTVTSHLKMWGVDVKPKYRTGERHGGWKGRVRTNAGYWDIFVAKDDFFYPMVRSKDNHGTGGYVREHRLVMAKHMNRCLLSWEVVHHINGIKDDNRIENLQLLPHSKYHLADTVSKSKIAMLEKEVAKLKKLLESKAS